jgi:hypothetical protein
MEVLHFFPSDFGVINFEKNKHKNISSLNVSHIPSPPPILTRERDDDPIFFFPFTHSPPLLNSGAQP